ncbi:MAG: hypothetical protein DLM65_07050 [Candidatus Aeolococcus gillhamiae]|uniref:Uncharacterized protein n=1 Tax=Candidatus Aeolococcus gillhamiae TaxID=3127015 RepID=A0A2W5ZDC4_9BACT|nr:MAG: hypothetical protein DLM65_07050 [Candidatus Dormibacter sp. RRmetagenome_bin12]
MRGTARLLLPGAACLALLCGCGPAPPGTPTSAPATPSAVANGSGSAAATASATSGGGPTQAELAKVEGLLYPSAPGGGDCLSSSPGPASVLACPVTQRLASALSAALANPNGAADPLCGCQAIDAHQTVTYAPGVPKGAGTIHVSAFGAPQVAYLVVSAAGQFLVDDVIYCSPSPHTIYGTAVTAC